MDTDVNMPRKLGGDWEKKVWISDNFDEILENFLPHILENKDILFIKFTKEYLPMYYKWAEKEHVKSEWFRKGYKPVDAILEKLEENSCVLPFIIEAAGINIGYIQYYRLLENDRKIFTDELEGTVGFDIFIGEEDYIGKGCGTQIVQEFSKMLFSLNGVKKIIVDPFTTNKQARRCYEKAGFSFVRTAMDDQGAEVIIMELRK